MSFWIWFVIGFFSGPIIFAWFMGKSDKSFADDAEAFKSALAQAGRATILPLFASYLLFKIKLGFMHG